ncbi:hypothetical protein [Actinoplanes sp. NPDC051494]|uniref:hypothetical protein n=1 Tax=Actinoplanes sp. NPDC051494 TaxID=3363907 RepID=UPI00378D2FA6
MLRKRTAALVATAAAGILGLTACGDSSVAEAPAAQAPADSAGSDQLAGLNLKAGTAKSNNAEANTGDWAITPGAQSKAPSEASQRWVQLTAAKAGDLDPVVVNGSRLTLYRFDKDTAKPSKSTCNGDCAVTWPPVTVKAGGKIFIAGIRKRDVGVVKRDDGRLQVTIGGWPVYRFSKDSAPGDTEGQGVGGTWFGVQPDGKKAAGGEDGGEVDIEEGTIDEDAEGGASPAPTGDAEPQDGAATEVMLFDEPNFPDTSAVQATNVSQGQCQNVRPNTFSSVASDGRITLWSQQKCQGESISLEPGARGTSDLTLVDFDNKTQSVSFG